MYGFLDDEGSDGVPLRRSLRIRARSASGLWKWVEGWSRPHLYRARRRDHVLLSRLHRSYSSRSCSPESGACLDFAGPRHGELGQHGCPGDARPRRTHRLSQTALNACSKPSSSSRMASDDGAAPQRCSSTLKSTKTSPSAALRRPSLRISTMRARFCACKYVKRDFCAMRRDGSRSFRVKVGRPFFLPFFALYSYSTADTIAFRWFLRLWKATWTVLLPPPASAPGLLTAALLLTCSLPLAPPRLSHALLHDKAGAS